MNLLERNIDCRDSALDLESTVMHGWGYGEGKTQKRTNGDKRRCGRGREGEVEVANGGLAG